MSQSILIITLSSLTGSVLDKAKLLVRHLRKPGLRVTVSHHATYRDYPKLVAALWQLFTGKKPKIQRGMCFDDFPCVSAGCWLLKFEFSYYIKSNYWRNLINNHQRHVVVGGTVLTSYILTKLAKVCSLWIERNQQRNRIGKAAQKRTMELQLTHKLNIIRILNAAFAAK